MDKKEKREFEIRVEVKNIKGDLIKLKKKVNLEITWIDDKGILNPNELKILDDDWSDKWGKGSYRRSKGEVVSFEKDGKKYDVIVKIHEIKIGWFKDEVRELEFFPFPNSTFFIRHGEENVKKSRWIWEKKPDWTYGVKPTQLRKKGPVLLGINIFFVLGIIVYYFYCQKKRKLTKR